MKSFLIARNKEKNIADASKNPTTEKHSPTQHPPQGTRRKSGWSAGSKKTVTLLREIKGGLGFFFFGSLDNRS